MLLLIIAPLFSGNTSAERPDKPESGVDVLERQLEIGRHEQLVAGRAHPDSVLAEYTTDGCSGGSREATAIESFEARKESNLVLKAYVLETGVKRTPELSAEYNVSAREVEILYTAIADLMYRAVRIGGMPCTGLPWRWGFGWPECE